MILTKKLYNCIVLFAFIVTSLLFVGCANTEETTNEDKELDPVIEEVDVKQTHDDTKEETNKEPTENDLIIEVKLAYLDEITYYAIGDIFNEQLFSDGEWSIKDGKVSFQGYFNKEIFPGEPSHITVLFHQSDSDYHYSITIKYNGEDVTQESHELIIDQIESLLQQNSPFKGEYVIGPWEAIKLVEEKTGLQYADEFDTSKQQYKTEPVPIQIFGVYTWIIPVIDPDTTSYVGELFVDWKTGDIYNDYGEIISH
ncbi:hypothetical protein BKP45_06780 [Anaerobacillus alkalidiazotrophicus]|uniref:Uncharacterized protein n=1 Tax=Anaerobacillus alkalidiazotrophicus TaxID=472963 RepID=A0A1S2MC66_9BACI|nr:hypothetical protein [Anaerobacillus alkalidiazotrophicus]OIJ22338.1 hypothetical protein BKP45_06780 [Anaerobacillus alkalidiazotrophicus]